MLEDMQDGLTHPLFIGVIIYYSYGYGPDNSSDLDSSNPSQNSDLNSLGVQLIHAPSHNINTTPSYLEYIYSESVQYLSQYSYGQLTFGTYAICFIALIGKLYIFLAGNR